MSKKDFKVKGGFDSLIGGEIDEHPKKEKRITRAATFVIERIIHEKIRTIAFLEDVRLSHVVDKALSEYADRYENIHGKLKVPRITEDTN